MDEGAALNRNRGGGRARGRSAAAAWLGFLLLPLFTALGAEGTIGLSGHAMGTTWSVRLVPPTQPVDVEVIRRRVADRLEELEQEFSTYRPTSEISRFNATRATGWVPVSREMADVAAAGRRISEVTGGAFDPTVAPLVQLWGFGAHRRTSPPRDDEVLAARELIGWRRLEVRSEPPAWRKSEPRVRVDFSSIVKGYAADVLGDLLVASGAERYFVQVGGDVKTGGAGAQADGEWRAGIEEPREGPPAIACVIGLADEALSTSGDYRNFTTFNGVRFGHIIDPRTGRPAASALAAVSVVHASAAWSSALATALFVLGPAEGLRLAQREGLACVFFVRDGDGITRRMTPEFARRVR